ncbi:MAG: transcriptional regulator GcvA [Minwuia sp.]|uniref:transcriptional regulator GcvA n=1 Tax=Minwuia sp. TaxID=2493630 RepID=UPI003A83CDCF
MPRRLPPLNALRAFEAAARHLSFARAADELNLTPSAISHQIKGLEDQVGVSLFDRRGRKVVLTDAGARYYPALRQAFDRMNEATEELKQSDSLGALTINVLPTFAIRWLLPRISDFQQRHPEIEVRMTTNVEVIDFRQSAADAAVRFGTGSWPGLTAHLLMTEEIVPVCSPKLLETGPGLKTPADLKHYQLLHDINRPDNWRQWLTAVGETSVDPDRGHKLESTNLAVQGALQGLGVVPANPGLVRGELEAGTLIEPFAYHLPVESGYYLVYPQGRESRPRLKAFQDWLVEITQGLKTEEGPSKI